MESVGNIYMEAQAFDCFYPFAFAVPNEEWCWA